MTVRLCCLNKNLIFSKPPVHYLCAITSRIVLLSQTLMYRAEQDFTADEQEFEEDGITAVMNTYDRVRSNRDTTTRQLTLEYARMEANDPTQYSRVMYPDGQGGSKDPAYTPDTSYTMVGASFSFNLCSAGTICAVSLAWSMLHLSIAAHKNIAFPFLLSILAVILSY